MRRVLSILLFSLIYIAVSWISISSYAIEIHEGDEPEGVVNVGEDDDDDAVNNSDGFSDSSFKDREQGWKKEILIVKNLWLNPKDNKYYTTSTNKLWVQSLDRNQKDKPFSTKDARVRKLEVKVDDGKYYEYIGNRSGKFSIETEGAHNIAFRATDVLGNTEKDRNVPVIVDNTPPNVTVAYEVKAKDGASVVSSNVVYVPCKHKIVFRATDCLSGVKYASKSSKTAMESEEDSEEPGEFEGEEEETSGKSGCIAEKGIFVSVDNKKFTVYNDKKGIANLKPGWHVVKAKAVDNVGNESAPIVTNVFVDNLKPVVRIKPKYDLIKLVKVTTKYYYDDIKGKKGSAPSEEGDDDDSNVIGDDDDSTSTPDIEDDGETSPEESVNRPGLFLEEEECDGCEDLNGNAKVEEDEEEGGSGANKLYAGVDNEYTVVAYDLQSGISDVFIKVDQKNKAWDVYRRPIQFSTSGDHTIYVKAYDKVGNSIEGKLALVVDNFPPDSAANEVESESVSFIEYQQSKNKTCK